MKTILLLCESLEPGNFHTGVFNGLISLRKYHIIPFLVPRDISFNWNIYDEMILKIIRKFKIDCLLAIQAEAVSKDVIIEANKRGIVTVIYQVDDPYILTEASNKEEHISKLKEYNFIYTTNLESVEEQYKNLDLEARFLPFGFDPYFHKNLKIDKVYDISFVGSTFKNREKSYIKPLLKNEAFKIDLFGSASSLWNHPGIINHKEMIQIVNQSKINLNFSDQPENNIKCLKNRVPEILGMEQFLLTEYFPESWELFEPDKNIVMFHSLYELKHKLKFYLQNNTAREKIAKAGYEHIKNTLTYESLLSKMLKEIEL